MSHWHCRAAKMPDALIKSITVPGWGALVKVRLATFCNSYPEGLLGPSSLGLAWEEPLQEVPTAADMPLPQQNRLKCSRCLRTWMVSWLCLSIYFLMACKTMTNVMSPLGLCGCLSRSVWAGLEWMPLCQGTRLNWGCLEAPCMNLVTSATLSLSQVMLTLQNATLWA